MAKLIQATLTSDTNWVTINGEPHLRGTFVRFDPVSFDGDLGVEVSFSSLNKLHISVDGTTVNGSTVSTQQELIDWFKTNSFKIGGGTGEGVQSISAGDGIDVDNTDPYNPIISATGGGNAVWGAIEGDLSDQTDLQEVLDEKADTSELSDVALSGSYADLEGVPTQFPPSAHTHNASDINAGTLADARIPNLNASKINAGTFADTRIPSLAISKITNLQSTLNSKLGLSPDSDQTINQLSFLDVGEPIPTPPLANTAYLVADDGLPNNVVSTATTLTLLPSSVYTYTGSTAATWTLPLIASSGRHRITIINIGAGTLTVQGNAGDTDAIYEGGFSVPSIEMNTGQVNIIYNNTIKWALI